MRTNMFLAHSVTFASILTAMACANSDVGQLADVETQTDQSQAPLAAAGSLSAPTSDVIGPVGLTGYVYHFGTEQLRASPPTASDLAAQVVQTAGTLPSSNFVYQPSGQGFSIQMSGGDAVATNQFIGSAAAGAARADTVPLQTTAIDFVGYIYFSATGTYALNLVAADDAAAAYVGGTGVPGSGNLVSEFGYAGSWPTPKGTVTVTTAGWYPLEIFWYNQMFGNDVGGAALSFNVSGPATVRVAGVLPAAPTAASGTPGLTVNVYHRGTDIAQAAPPTAAIITEELAYANASPASYSFVATNINTSAKLSLTGGDATSTASFLGALASGAALQDKTPLQTTLLDFSGTMLVSRTGVYKVSLQGDDAAAVFLGGSGTPGSGTLIVERNYNGSIAAAPGGANPQSMLLTPGSYPIEIFWYNQVYGRNAGAAQLGFSVTGPAAVTFNTSTPANPNAPGGSGPSGGNTLVAPTVVPAPQPILWSPSMPAWPVAYTASQITAQQAAGAAMLNSLASAVASGASSYTIAPGTYRISSAILLQNTSGFTLNAPNVEIIAENNAGFFTLFTNRNLTVRGPLTLDSNPIDTSQGRIVSVDAANNSVMCKSWLAMPPRRPTVALWCSTPTACSYRIGRIRP